MSIKKRSGFTLLELLVTLLILGVMFGVGNSFGVDMLRLGRVDSANSTLSSLSSEFKFGIENIGVLSAEDLSDGYKRYQYFDNLSNPYLHTNLNLLGITYVNHEDTNPEFDFGSEYDGAVLTTQGCKDPWGSEYRIYYLVSSTTSGCMMFIASPGADGVFAPAAAHSYLEAVSKIDFEDDHVVAISCDGSV